MAGYSKIAPKVETCTLLRIAVCFQVSDVPCGDDASLYLLDLKLATNAAIVFNKAGTEFYIREFNLKSKKLRVSE